MTLMHITTASGFEMDVDPDVINDMELIDAVVELEGGDATAYPVVTGKLLGSDKSRLYDHIRDDNGRVPQERFTEELRDIFGQLGKKK